MFRVSGSESLKIIPPFFPTAVFFGCWILGPPKSRTLGYRCQFGHRRQPWFLFRHKMGCTSFVKREVRYPTNFYTKMGKAGDRILITKKTWLISYSFQISGVYLFFSLQFGSNSKILELPRSPRFEKSLSLELGKPTQIWVQILGHPHYVTSAQDAQSTTCHTMEGAGISIIDSSGMWEGFRCLLCHPHSSTFHLTWVQVFNG